MPEALWPAYVINEAASTFSIRDDDAVSSLSIPGLPLPMAGRVIIQHLACLVLHGYAASVSKAYFLFMRFLLDKMRNFTYICSHLSMFRPLWMYINIIMNCPNS